MLNHGVTCNLGTTKVCSPAIFETDFSYHRFDLLDPLLGLQFFLYGCVGSWNALSNLA